MMATESWESIELEAQRAELETVLHSEYFTRAPMLAQLLRYLCEKLFVGEAHQIKEYSVGLDVFHRCASFDQNADSIVRVEANRLRKQLATYYAGPGASNRLRITIPLGQYVPEFVVIAPALPSEKLEIPLEVALPQKSSSAAKPWLHRWQWPLGTAVALLLAGCTLLFFVPKKPAAPIASVNSGAAPSAESLFGPPLGEEVRILAGSSRGFVDHAGKLWGADFGFDGGSAVKSPLEHIWRTMEPGFYRTSRQGSFHYAIPLKKGIYELRLHFAETVYDQESTGGEGSRQMRVRANGKTLLNRFDVMADAGASRTADVKVFTDIAPASDGLLHLEFEGEQGKQAILSAIEILPGFRGRIRPVRLLARSTPYYSNDSHWWSPDSYFQGGQLAAYSAAVKGTDDPELFETERWGNFTYAIPVPQGKYSVTLYFAARHGDWDQPSSPNEENRPAVPHIFDVFCNGQALLKHFNLADEAHGGDVVIRKTVGLEANAQGKLLLSFVPVEGYATVTGIEVVPQ